MAPMITAREIEIEAPAATVWDVYRDVEAWPRWTPSVTKVVPLDEPGIAVGRRFSIEQPRMPRLEWEVTAMTEGTSWTWRQRSPGATTLGFHELVPLDTDRTLVRLGVDQRGPIGVAFGVLTRRLTRRALDLEARGLKERCEAARRDETDSAQ